VIALRNLTRAYDTSWQGLHSRYLTGCGFNCHGAVVGIAVVLVVRRGYLKW